MNRLADYLSLHLLRKTGIRHRLAGAFVLLSLLPLVVAGSLSYVESTRAIAARTRLFSAEVVKQVAGNIQLQMAKMEADSEAMVLSDRIQTALAQYAGDNQMERSAARTDLTRVLLERYGSFDYINQKYFLDTGNRIMDTQVFSSLGRGVVRYVEQAPKLHGRPHWGIYDNGSGQKSMVLLRAIYSKANNSLVGNLFLGIRPSHFSAIFEDVNLGAGSDIFMLDGQDGALMVRAPGAAGDGGGPAPDPALAAEIRRSLLHNQASGAVAWHGHDGAALAVYAQIPGSSWFVVGSIPLEQLATEAGAVRDTLVLIGALCCVLAIGLAAVIARSIAGPLDALVQRMRETGSGNHGGRVPAEGNDELTVLAQQFNEMADLLDQQQLQLEERVAERTRELAAANQQLTALSMNDAPTGIANRRRFDEALAAELQRAARAHAPLALMMLDLDFFKAYNALYGQQQGDACLRRVARLLESHSRRGGDLAARYGGAEFAMIAADTDADAAFVLAEAIRASLEALRLPHERSPLGSITASIGVAALAPGAAASPAALVRMAEQAMYRAKEQGRNQVVAAGRKPPARGIL